MPRTFRRRPARVLATALLLAGSVPHLFGYAFESHSWPLGSNVPVRLGLGPASSGFLQDGFSSFDASAADALNAWKQYTNLISLTWSTVPGASSDNDGINEAFFASTVYGQAFGSGVLAVTLSRTNGAITLEADNIFNSALLWDSYRGALQYNSKKRQYTFDFHRVALHEFGHTLGLAHPDDYGQTVTAIMNSHVSDLDHLAPDDIVGMKWLYGIRITSPLAPPPVEAGDHFTYQITANNSPTSYAASNLPPGLQLNGATGAISGVPSQA